MRTLTRKARQARMGPALLATVLAALPSAHGPSAVARSAPPARGVLVRIPLVASPPPDGAPRGAQAAAATPIRSLGEAVDGPGTPPGALPDPAASPGPAPGGVIRVSEADGYNPAFTTGPSTGPCARASTCPDFLLRPARWPRGPGGRTVITWKFNDAGRRAARAPAGLLEAAMRSQTAEWSHWDSNIVFRYGGLTTAAFGASGPDGSCADGTNVVTWVPFDPSIIGEAALCLDRSGRVVRDADLALNPIYHWEDIEGRPATAHSMDIRSIVTHELGHWLGLLDLYDPADVHLTMSGYSRYGETSKRTPGLGDILGVQKAFGCGPGVLCPRTGISDD